MKRISLLLMAAGLLAPMAANAFTIKDASGSVIYDSNKTNVIEDINENATELSIVLGDNEVFPSGNLPNLYTRYTQSDWGDRYELKDAPKIFRQFFTKLNKVTITGDGNIGGVISTDAFNDLKTLETVVVEKASKISERSFYNDFNIKDVYVNSDRKIECAKTAFAFETTDAQTDPNKLDKAATLHVTTSSENLAYYYSNIRALYNNYEFDHVALLNNRNNSSNGWQEFVKFGNSETQTIINDDDVAQDALRTWSSNTTTMIPSYMSVFVVECDGKSYSLKRLALDKVTKDGDAIHTYYILPPKNAVVLFNQKDAIIKLYRADSKGVSLPYALDDIPVVGLKNNQLIPMCDKDGVQLYTTGTRNGKAYSTYFFGNSENTTRAQYFKETYGNNKSFYGFFKAKNYVCHKNNIAYLEVPTTINANQYLGFVSLDCQMKSDATLAQNFHAKDGGILFSAWDDESETTGISDVETAVKADNNFYTLTGVKVANPSKGIFIHNGKKVVIK